MDDFLMLQIYKLGHGLAEIRLRALDNILAKLELGLVPFGALIDSPDFVKHLVRWLSYSPPVRTESIFKLLLQVAEEGGGKSILKYDPSLKILDKSSRPDCRVLFNDIATICNHLSVSSSALSSFRTASSVTNCSGSSEKRNVVGWLNLWPQQVASSDRDTLSAVSRSLRDPNRSAHALRFVSSIVLADFPASSLLCRSSLAEVILDICESKGENAKLAFACLEDLMRNLLCEVKQQRNLHLTTLFYNVNGSAQMELISSSCSEESSMVLYKEYSNAGTRSRSSNVEDPLPLGEFIDRSLTCSVVAGLGKRLVLIAASLKASAVCSDTSPSLQLINALADIAASHTLKGDERLFETQLLVWAVLKDWDVPAGGLPTRLLQALQKWSLDPALTLFYPKATDDFVHLLTNAEWSETSLQREAGKIAQALGAASQWLMDYEKFTSTDLAAQAVDLFSKSLEAIEYHQKYSVISQFVEFVISRHESIASEGLKDDVCHIMLRLLSSGDPAIQRTTLKELSSAALSHLGPASARQDSQPVVSLQPIIVDSRIIIHLISFCFVSPDDEVARESKDIVAAALRCRSTLNRSEWDVVAEVLVSALPYLIAAVATAGSPISPAVLALLDPDLASPSLSHTTVLLGNIGLLLSRDAGSREEAINRLMFLLDIASRPINLVLPHDPISAQNKVVGMYESESVLRVLEVLRDKRTTGRVIRSSLMQLSLMTEDSLLHELFIAHGGLSVLLDRLNPASEDFKDNFGPVISSLKNIAKYNSRIRNEMSSNDNLLRNIVRGLFCTCCDWRSERDVAQLLALLVFGDCVLIDSSGRVSLPQAILRGIRSPFQLASHNEIAEYSSISYRDELLNDCSCRKLLAAHWAVGLAGGVEALLDGGIVESENNSSTDLAISRSLLGTLTSAHPSRNVTAALDKLASATSHNRAFDAVDALDRYLWVCKTNSLKLPNNLPWEQVLLRYLQTSPATTSDQQLLLSIIQLINHYYEYVVGDNDWLKDILQGPSTVLIYFLKQTIHEKCTSLKKEVCVGWLKLVERCIRLSRGGWLPLILVLIGALDDRHSQRFYSLGVMEGILQCLVQVRDEDLKEIEVGGFIQQGVEALCRLVPAFHSYPASSFMGASILKLTLLVLNSFLIADPNFIAGVDIDTILVGLKSCDPQLRAATLQLLTTLVRTSLPKGDSELWREALRLLLDGGEVKLVRQMAATLCTIIIHNRPNSKDLVAECRDKWLFRTVALLVNNLTFNVNLSLVQISKFQDQAQESFSTSTSVSNTNAVELLCTPELLIASLKLVLNISVASSDIIVSLQQQNLSLALFRYVAKWCAQDRISSDKEKELMRIVCKILSLCPTHCPLTCLQQVLSSLVWILQPSSFGLEAGDYSELWVEALNLFAALVSNFKDTSVPLTSECIAAICTSVESPNPANLQASAFAAIPSLMHIFDSRSAEAVGKSTAIAWDRESRLGRARGKACSAALAALLASSHAATAAALETGVVDTLVTRLRRAFVDIAVLPPPAPTLPKTQKWNAMLLGVSADVGLLTNAMAGSEAAKEAANALGIADCIHKLWPWCVHDGSLLSALLQLLVTLSANFPAGAHSLVLTSTMAGTGPRKTPHSASVLHAAVALPSDPSQPLAVRKTALVLCSHACLSPESRVVLSKSSILKNYATFASEKKSNFKDELEVPWLDFLTTLTSFPEGQNVLLKHEDVQSALLQRLIGGHASYIYRVVKIFRNVSFHTANKPKLISCGKLMTWMGNCLSNEFPLSVKKDIAVTVWSIAVNCQRNKQQLRALGFLPLLELASVDRETVTDIEACRIFNNVISVLKPFA